MFIKKKLNILTNLNIRAKIGKYFCVLEMCQVFEISRQKSRFSSIIDLEKIAANSQKISREKFREKFNHFFFFAIFLGTKIKSTFWTKNVDLE